MNHQQFGDHRQQFGDPACKQARGTRGIMARRDAGPQAAHVGDSRAGEQDGAHCLGAAHEERGLQGSGDCSGISQAAIRGRRRTTSGRRRVWRNSRPSVPTTVRQSTAGNLALRARMRYHHGYAAYSKRRDELRRRRRCRRGRPQADAGGSACGGIARALRPATSAELRRQI